MFNKVIIRKFLGELRSRKGSFLITNSNPFIVKFYSAEHGGLIEERAKLVFHNKAIDRSGMKRLISRLTDHFGIAYTSHILD